MGAIARALGKLFYWINRKYYWYQLPPLIGFLNLIALRVNLRAKNLFNTTPVWPSAPSPESLQLDVMRFRTPDGSHNDTGTPAMGMRRTRFGRNFGFDHTAPKPETLLVPNPRVISRRLLRREKFQEAGDLNLLVVAWIQFQIHDWVSHGRNDRQRPITLELDRDDDWPLPDLLVPATTADPTFGGGNEGTPPTFLSHESHWWDASALYGDAERNKELRTGVGGKLKLLPNGLLPVENGLDLTGNNNNWWIGLSVVHTLFTREHNAVCDMLAAVHPQWPDDRLFHTGRLVMTALIAKIHTIEWTPALLNTRILRIGMRGNWWGLLGERVRKTLGRLTANDMLSGIPGSQTDHHGTPYAMTEEFVAVYRMHSLMPDDFVIRSAETGEVLGKYTLVEVSNTGARRVLDEVGMHNLLYHLGTAKSGALVLRNYPRGLQELERQDRKGMTDLASVEILRDRERGVPRYNDFRALLDMPRIRSFAELTADPALAKEIETVYGGDIDQVDTMIGLMAETPPPGFAISDTAFRIFILMASRRLKSDRFFTTHFTTEVYSKEGMDWVQNTTFADMLGRHFPDIAAKIPSGKSPFAPWGKPAQ